MYLDQAAGFDRDRISIRDAGDGLGAIADRLNQGLMPLEQPNHGRFRLGDVLAIGLGWLVLVSVILYPALQLAAIAIGILFYGGKSFLRIVLGPASEPVAIVVSD